MNLMATNSELMDTNGEFMTDYEMEGLFLLAGGKRRPAKIISESEIKERREKLRATINLAEALKKLADADKAQAEVACTASNTKSVSAKLASVKEKPESDDVKECDEDERIARAHSEPTKKESTSNDNSCHESDDEEKENPKKKRCRLFDNVV